VNRSGPAAGRKRREPAVDAAARRTVHADSVLRESANGGVAGNTGFRGESEAGRTAYGSDGHCGRVSEAETEPAGRRPQDLPVPAEGR
jgi:hypothetical protein